MELVGFFFCVAALLLTGSSYYDVNLEEGQVEAVKKIQRRFVVMRIAFIFFTTGFLIVMGTWSFKSAPFPFHAFTTMVVVGLAIAYGQYSARMEFLAWRRGENGMG